MLDGPTECYRLAHVFSFLRAHSRHHVLEFFEILSCFQISRIELRIVNGLRRQQNLKEILPAFRVDICPLLIPQCFFVWYATNWLIFLISLIGWMEFFPDWIKIYPGTGTPKHQVFHRIGPDPVF